MTHYYTVDITADETKILEVIKNHAVRKVLNEFPRLALLGLSTPFLRTTAGLDCWERVRHILQNYKIKPLEFKCCFASSKERPVLPMSLNYFIMLLCFHGGSDSKRSPK